MKLQEIKGSYDEIVSLGSACNPSIHLKRLHLRTFSGPLDWHVSLSLSDVSRLLKNSFKDFMVLKNMCLIDGSAHVLEDGVPIQSVKSHFVKDNYYNILSVHDFPIVPNQHWTMTYSSYRDKMNRRIDRFIEKMTTSQNILFVRWNASYEQAVELQAVLSEIVTGQFVILILKPAEGTQVVSLLDWGIDRVCSLEVPNDPNRNATWDYVLNGIQLAK
ncbi:DUF1796 family putative cysteine peptidase [Paenibacillus planticolens]|uniref:Peptidase n=1 Tax=Paenibacillus planticolens TaxID=2654976 RepID=A0ABX1ZFJ9_9BACL|nr:DUF1796 family putative cysteine peptidase [Paenibacillus planticolens]NOU98869.1 peptidase [Paenibacillus planticolens]